MDHKTPTPEEFKDLRQALFSRQRECAEEMGVITGTVSRWERGTRAIPIMAMRLLRAWRALGGPR